jgi:hypothetical protein
MSNACARCGAPLAADARFCGQCGTPVVPDAAAGGEAAEATTRLPPAAAEQPQQAATPGPEQAAAADETGVQAPADLFDAAATRGFLASLFDVSFSHFITSRVVSLLYVLSMIGIALGYLVVAVALFGQSSGAGVVWLIIIGPIAALVELVWVRVLLEVAVVFFRINGTSREILTTLQRRG